jgi:putative membrane protein
MLGFVVRTLITAGALAVAAAVVPGITVSSAGTLILAALIMGLVNALVRPLVVLLTLPLTLATLGLFLLVVNAAMFGLVAWLLDGFDVSGFFAALLGWLIVSLVSSAVSWFIGPHGRYEVLIVERRRR